MNLTWPIIYLQETFENADGDGARVVFGGGDVTNGVSGTTVSLEGGLVSDGATKTEAKGERPQGQGSIGGMQNEGPPASLEQTACI
jgi:hypothetical protein